MEISRRPRAVSQTTTRNENRLTMKCQECGSIGDGLSFCTECGTFIPMTLELDDDPWDEFWDGEPCRR